MADDLEVKLGADTSDLKSGTSDAASSVEDSLKKIQDSLDGLSTKSKKTSDDVKTHTDGMAAAFAALHENIRVRFGSINNVFEQFSSKLAVLGAVFAGGALFKGAVSSLLELEDSVRGLVITFGMSTDAATKQVVALKLAGLSAETYEQMGMRVGRVLRTQSEEFDRLGVKTKDASGNLLPMDQILQNVYQWMQAFKAGTDQTEFALSTVGRNAKDFASDMERLNAVTDRAATVQARLGIEMGPDRIRQVEQYRQNLNEFKLVLEAIGERIGETVLPRLDGMATWFNDVGPRAIGLIIDAVKVFMTVMTALGSLIASIAIYATSQFENMATRIQAASKILNTNISDAWTEVPKIIADADAKIEANNKAAAESVTATWKEAADKVNALWSGMASRFGMNDRGIGQTGGLPGTGSERFKAKPVGGGGDDRLAQFKSELDDMNLANGAFLQLSKQNEMEFWEEKLALVKGMGKQDVALRAEINREILRARNASATEELAADVATLKAQEIAHKNDKDAQIADAVALTALMKSIWGEQSAAYQKYLGEETAIREAWAKKEEDTIRKIAEIEQRSADETAKFRISMNRIAEDQAVALRQISNEQRLTQEKSFVQQEYDIDVAGINARLAAETAGTVEYEKLLAEKLKLDQNFQKQLTVLDNQAELERKQVALQAAADVENAFGTFIDDLISRNKTLKQSFQDLVKSLTSDLNKLASQEIAKQLLGPGTTGGGFLNNIFGKIFGGGAGDATLQATHTEALTADTTATATLTTSLLAANTALTAFTASLAASGGGAGITAIGGSVFGEGGAGVGFGFSDALASFDVGTPYVPQDTLAVVHKGEAIIPAAMNKGGAVATGPMHMHFYISGNPDSRTLDQIQAAAARGASKSTRSVM